MRSKVLRTKAAERHSRAEVSCALVLPELLRPKHFTNSLRWR